MRVQSRTARAVKGLELCWDGPKELERRLHLGDKFEGQVCGIRPMGKEVAERPI